MRRFIRFCTAVLLAAALPLLPAGCSEGKEDGDGSGGNAANAATNAATNAAANAAAVPAIADTNDPNLVACLGDSITEGSNSEGVPYPSRLAAMAGKRVLNYGAGGTTSSAGIGAVATALGRRPGYVCILYGANDCISGVPAETTVAHLRHIVRACRNNGTKAIVATPTPMTGSHERFNAGAAALAPAIKAMAKEEGADCVDLFGAFGSGAGLLGEDGLHMTDAGNDLIARKFNSKL